MTRMTPSEAKELQEQLIDARESRAGAIFLALITLGLVWLCYANRVWFGYWFFGLLFVAWVATIVKLTNKMNDIKDRFHQQGRK